jgi:hypothetical protein
MKAISGMETWPSNQPAITVLRTTYTPAQLTAKLQQVVAPLQAVVDARSNLVTTLAARDEAIAEAAAFIAAFFSVLVQYLPPGTDVTKFGDKPKKTPAKPTAEQKAAANAKRKATRAARHIMGKNQRKAIVAPAPPAPATPATPATPPAKPAP